MSISAVRSRVEERTSSLPVPTIVLPVPHAGQKIVREQSKRFNWLSAGRRWRKTTLAMSIAVEGAAKKQIWIWGAPTFKQVRVAWEESKHAAGSVAEFKVGTMTAHFPSGGRIHYISLDNPDNARGFTADGVVMDEVADISQDAWYQVMRPMLIDTNGVLWAIGTPKGQNWFFREWVSVRNRDDSVSWRVPTVGCRIVGSEIVREPHPLENPHIPFSEIEFLYKTLPTDTFKQEILAEFVEGSGQVFRNLDRCMFAENPAKQEDHAGHVVVVGVDWGKQQDFTAISVVCKTCKREVDRDKFNKIDYDFQKERLKLLVEKWGVKAILPERNAAGDPIIERLRKEGFPIMCGSDGLPGFATSMQSKTMIVEALSLAMEKGDYQWQNDPAWTIELEAYERTISQTGKSSFSAPEGMHDDTVIARALALYASRNMFSTIIMFG